MKRGHLTQRVEGQHDTVIALAALERRHVSSQLGGVAAPVASAGKVLALEQVFATQQCRQQCVSVTAEELSTRRYLDSRSEMDPVIVGVDAVGRIGDAVVIHDRDLRVKSSSHEALGRSYLVAVDIQDATSRLDVLLREPIRIV